MTAHVDAPAGGRIAPLRAVQVLANARDAFGLPQPSAVHAEPNWIVTLYVADLDEVHAWNKALGGESEPHTSTYPSRGPIHGVFVHSWRPDWIVYITADMDAEQTRQDATAELAGGGA